MQLPAKPVVNPKPKASTKWWPSVVWDRRVERLLLSHRAPARRLSVSGSGGAACLAGWSRSEFGTEVVIVILYAVSLGRLDHAYYALVYMSCGVGVRNSPGLGWQTDKQFQYELVPELTNYYPVMFRKVKNRKKPYIP
jgi:hypothetical protein